MNLKRTFRKDNPWTTSRAIARRQRKSLPQNQTTSMFGKTACTVLTLRFSTRRTDLYRPRSFLSEHTARSAEKSGRRSTRTGDPASTTGRAERSGSIGGSQRYAHSFIRLQGRFRFSAWPTGGIKSSSTSVNAFNKNSSFASRIYFPSNHTQIVTIILRLCGLPYDFLFT